MIRTADVTTPEDADAGHVSVSAAEQVAADLRRRILAGEIVPGERIRQEEVAERFGVSRLPVREALRMLEAEGLTELETKKSARVPLLGMRQVALMYQMRERLEPLSLSESIPNLTGAQIDRLIGAVTRLWNSTQYYRRAFMMFSGPQRRWVVNAEHSLLLNAIRRRDIVEGEHFLTVHIRRTRIELERHPELFPQP